MNTSDIDYASRQCGLSNGIYMIEVGFDLVLHDFDFGIGLSPLKNVKSMIFQFNFLSRYTT